MLVKTVVRGGGGKLTEPDHPLPSSSSGLDSNESLRESVATVMVLDDNELLHTLLPLWKWEKMSFELGDVVVVEDDSSDVHGKVTSK